MFIIANAMSATVSMFLAGEIDAATMNATVELYSNLCDNVQPYCSSYDPML